MALDRQAAAEVEARGELVTLADRLGELNEQITVAEANLNTLKEDRARVTKLYEVRLEIIQRPGGGVDPAYVKQGE